ncbi:group-specific protein [Virgibacillus sp. 6R]|uniref:group-specific protein n=1 Tax=Metabacillus sp. 22489 TaxID=3453928 RepID=UPI0011A3A184
MTSCNLNHSLEDVRKKLEQQAEHLEKYYSGCSQFLENNPTQQQLNELFHLLKKYDLADEEEKSLRERKIYKLISQKKGEN